MPLPPSLGHHRVRAEGVAALTAGRVRYAPVKSLWFLGMASVALVGGWATFSWQAVLVFLCATAFVLLFGHSLGSHRKLIHNSFDCPKWLERLLVYAGVQVGLAGPIGLLRQHELRDYAQRLPDCHPYLRHGSGFWKDAWWQLNCELQFDRPPHIALEPRIANDAFYRWLERTWMLQQLGPALVLYACGGWAFVVWGVCARITAGVFGHWLIGYFAHNHGPMHFVVDGAAVQGRNIPWASLLTMGECWHNNHHAYPGSSRLGVAPGEWDPGWWALCAMRRLGWVWNLRLPADLPARPELRALDTLLADAAVLEPPSMTWLWRQTGAASGRWLTLRSPALHARVSWLRAVVGPNGTVMLAVGSRRLTAWVGSTPVHGLPALWLAAARRHAVLRWLLLPALPLAVGAEAARGFFSVPQGPAQA